MDPFDSLLRAQQAALLITRNDLLKKREKLMERLEEINREMADGEEDESERE